MGTNYYARYSPCPTCHRCSAEKHIGKASGGWRFLLQAHEHNLSSWRQWKEELALPGVEIWNEYNERISLEELMEIVEEKQRDPKNIKHLEYDPSIKCWYVDQDGYDMSSTEFS